MLLSFLLAMSAYAADTLEVATAQSEVVCTVYEPYSTENADPQGRAYNKHEVMDRNRALLKKSTVRKTVPETITKGTALGVGADSLPVLRILRFTVQSPRYFTGNVVVNKLRNYKIFVDGAENYYGNFSLAPGRHDVALQVLTEKADRDTFNVCITGDSLQGVTVNPTGKRSYTMQDMLLGKHYYLVEISPSGKYLAVVTYNSQPDGTALYKTTLSELATGREMWSRNEYVQLKWLKGNKDVLYYARPGSEGRELVFYTPADDKEEVIAQGLPEGEFSISPKADYLIFSLYDAGQEGRDGLKRLKEPDDRMPNWRSRYTLWRYDIASGAMCRLTFGNTSVGLSDISSDAKHLLLHTSSFDATKQPFERKTFLQMDAYTGKVDTLLADTAFVEGAIYSPDGTQLLLNAATAAFNGIGSELPAGKTPNFFDYRLYLYDIASKSASPLLSKSNASVDEYHWLPGDGMIYFRAAEGTSLSLFRLNPRTKQVTRFALPVSYVERFSLSSPKNSAPEVAFFGQTAERARELFCGKLDKAAPSTRRIGEIDFDKLYADVAIGTSHDWRFKATRGDSIDGYYLLPPDFDASKKYPLIVYYYGGCLPTQKMLEYQYPLQVFAGLGYVVYVVNPSGCTGYGEEFASRHVNTWGKESGDDIIEGTKRFCAEHSFVDSTKVGCIGASYGGFMTQYLQTRTDIFAAAVSHAGISNIASYWGGGYWGYSYGETAQFGSYPWNNPDLYVKHSPLYNADKIRTPLLLLHGTADTNVPTNESQQLYNALKILGRDVAYVQVDGEDHAIRDYRKRIAWQNVIFAWFAKYLQGDSAWWNSLRL